ncbi:hypothetical protein ACP4OV_016356 [Aristida adscensionis]
MASYHGKKVDLIVAFLTLVTLNVSYTLATNEQFTSGLTKKAMKARHKMWMVEYGQSYKDEVEKAHRFKYHFAINEFANMSNQEFMAMYARSEPMVSTVKKISGFKYVNATLTKLPKEIDWTKKGAVTKIKNQKDCGCCWAICVVGAMEGIHWIKTGQLLSLSEQHLLDCSNHKNDCSSGFKGVAFQYIVDNGIAIEDTYPYTGKKGLCRSFKPVVKITGFEVVPEDNEDALAAAVAHQPVVVSIDGSKFQFYGGGVMLGHGCGTDLNHGMTLVGYGLIVDGTKYWLLKNQWGKMG